MVEMIEGMLDGFDRVIQDFTLGSYSDEWIVELVDRTRLAARTELAALKEIEKKATRLCETIWQRQWSNPEDCLMDAIDLMKVINPDHPMAKVRTLREELAAKKDSYIAIRKENKKLQEGLNLIEGQVAHIGGNRKFRLGTAYGIERCAEIARSYLEGGDEKYADEDLATDVGKWLKKAKAALGQKMDVEGGDDDGKD